MVKKSSIERWIIIEVKEMRQIYERRVEEIFDGYGLMMMERRGHGFDRTQRWQTNIEGRRATVLLRQGIEKVRDENELLWQKIENLASSSSSSSSTHAQLRNHNARLSLYSIHAVYHLSIHDADGEEMGENEETGRVDGENAKRGRGLRTREKIVVLWSPSVRAREV
ncbi:hypothetical protein LguiA_007561 [Lonicera macranthoides]